MKSICLTLLAFLIGQSLFAQQVGIGTLAPHESAALHINSTDKGVLLPRVSLKSLSDDVTIASPANSLLIYNTNFALKYGAGFYYNAGGAGGAQPTKWESVGKAFELPYYGSDNDDGTLFHIENLKNSASSAAIKATGFGQTTGIITQSGSGLALDVSGKVKISGNGQTPAAGKVLTSDANGNATWEGAVAFSAVGVVGGGSEVVAPSTDTKVPFANVVYNLGDNYRNANQTPHSSFVVTIPGIYHFEADVTWGLSSPNEINSALRLIRTRNNTRAFLTNVSIRNLSAGSAGGVSFDCLLEVGDIVHVEIKHEGGSGDPKKLDDSDSRYAHFSGRLIMRQ